MGELCAILAEFFDRLLYSSKRGRGMFFIFPINVRLTVNIRHSDQSELKTPFTNSHSKCPFWKDGVLGK